ncbi:hypothetical protein DPX16_23697 [Anabarilius grahami]|uniref:Uncharacterized protein n=1 Tax=Anabarilius grahami TaxID=495550 RepID=A0A3N0Y7U4_ANAGA|nr:hypothetical protein DPX16_23697 [Anabarilius grahami]
MYIWILGWLFDLAGRAREDCLTRQAPPCTNHNALNHRSTDHRYLHLITTLINTTIKSTHTQHTLSGLVKLYSHVYLPQGLLACYLPVSCESRSPSVFLVCVRPDLYRETTMSQQDPFQALVDALRRTLTINPPTPSTITSPSPAPAVTSVNTVPSSSPPVYASPMATPAPYAGSAEDCSGFLLQCELVRTCTLTIQPK